ncbi:MAG: GNAT family N-acetyltransferase [Bacteroidota bacterium]
MIQIVKATEDGQLKEISNLAVTIWQQHYTPIIGAGQVTYMLQKFQSVPAIQKQIKAGAEYYLLTSEGNAAGYFCITLEEGALFLSKLYVLSTYRGKGLGKRAMHFIMDRAVVWQCQSIRLTVNKNNTGAIRAYQKMGFKNMGSVVQDIGNGYVMDDYLLENELSA